MALTAKKVYAILKRQISDMEAKLNSPVRYRGTVATADLLPLNPDIGDMYNIESKSVYGEAGMNVAWNGVVWDTMGAPIDMSLYIKSNELADWVKQQNKPTYTAEEVGALPDTTVIPSKTSDLQNDSGFLTKIPDNYLSGTDKTLNVSGKAADAKATGDKITELSADISNKLNKNQGSENSGKIAGINESGDIVPMFPVSVDYNEETNCLEFGSDQKMELNKGINLDNTLTKTGYAADAGAVGKITDSLKEDLGNINDVLEIVEKQNYSPKAATISKAYTPVKMQENISLKKNKTYRFYFKIDGKKSDIVYCNVTIKGEDKSVHILTGKLESEFIYKAEEDVGNVYTQTQADGALIGTVVTSYIECLDDVNSKNKIEKLQYNINNLCNEFDSCFCKKNLFNKNGNLIIDKALISDGELIEDDKYITSNLIFVKKGDLLSIYPRVFSFAFYDTNKIFDNTYFNKEDTQKPMNVPAAPYDGYIRVTLYKSDLEVFTIGYGAINQPYDFGKIEITDKIVPDFRNDFLNNKKWAVCGDSFTSGATGTLIDNGKYYGFPKTYPYFIGNRTGINIINFHNGGQTLAYPASHDFANSLTCPNSDKYYQNIPADVGYVTIYLGINDESHAVGNSDYGESVTGIIPIGTITDNDTSTYYGAWNVVLSWLIENRPKAHIGIIISNGLVDVAYRNAQLEIAKKYGIPFIDLNGDSNTPAMIRSCNPDIDSDVKEVINKKWRVSESNTHPNDDAHEYESYFIESFLRRI